MSVVWHETPHPNRTARIERRVSARTENPKRGQGGELTWHDPISVDGKGDAPIRATARSPGVVSS
ncbi:hypothetical protein MACH15_20890 [Maricaulis maris]|jgi:hypothetical protein|nr:hypothetical protein MACH15_20890 [Maricaulis maris]